MTDLITRLNQPGSCLLVEGFLGRPALFTRPETVLACADPARLPDVMAEVERGVRAGNYAVGFISYEAGYSFVELPVPAVDFPLLCFGLYREPEYLTLPTIPGARPPGQLSPPVPELAEADYLERCGRVRDLIRAGDTYQVNLTFRTRAQFSGDPAAFFLDRLHHHPVPYAAYLNLGSRQALSLSPELFLARAGDQLTARPMKGTVARGGTPAEDEARKQWLLDSAKNRAENVMIVDLLRNDLGRVAEYGSVRVENLCRAEPYATVWQLTSTIAASLRPEVSWGDIIRATFPSGSVTGAPKRRTMELIRELERSPRKLYTGSLGVIRPDGDFVFNVAIRTAIVEAATGTVEIGVGGGIVIDSDPRAEWDEALLKLGFLTHQAPPPALIETMRYLPGTGIPLLARHLARLATSAAALGFAADPERIREELARAMQGLMQECVVRLELDRSGALAVTTRPLPSPPPVAGVTVAIAAEPVRSTDPWLRHKTTRRDVYDRWRRQAEAAGVFEYLFLNERGELTEGTITNLFARIEGKLVTPAPACGLLPGVMRAVVLEETGAQEGTLTPADLDRASEVFLTNAVRGRIPVAVIRDGTGRERWRA